MYKLILVDDEEEVRKGIIKKIKWDQYGFEVIGEAENGIEALDIAEKIIPDILITDIKMPFMDGITLAEKFRKKYPVTKIIILTGFDEFEYAHKAIKLDITEYILKPISSTELIEVLLKVKEKIDEEFAQKKDIEKLKEHYNKSLPILQEKFFSSLITNGFSNEEIKEKSYNYSLNIDGKGFATAVLSIDETKEYLKEDNIISMQKDIELLQFAILNIFKDVIIKYNVGIAFLHDNHIVSILIFQEDNKDAIMKKVLTILEEVRLYVEKYIKHTATIGVGNFCDDLSNIKYSYKNAINALDYSLIVGKNKVIYIEDMEPCQIRNLVFDENKDRLLSSFIKVGTSEEIKDIINSLFDEIINKKVSFKSYQVYLLEMITTILKVAEDFEIDIDHIFGDDYNLFVELYKFKNLIDVKEWITEICIKIKGYISQSRKNICKLIVEDAIKYIKDNYGSNDITIDKICGILHISSAYFSSIFKKETKLTFINYLTEVRMEKAKELLRTTNLKTFEIANRVGYSEANYFSYCFKKRFGSSPSEYRNYKTKN